MHRGLASEAAGTDFPLYRPRPEHVHEPQPAIASPRDPPASPIRTASRDFLHPQGQITPETAPRLTDGIGELIQVEILCVAFKAVQIENDPRLSPALHGLDPFGHALLK